MPKVTRRPWKRSKGDSGHQASGANKPKPFNFSASSLNTLRALFEFKESLEQLRHFVGQASRYVSPSDLLVRVYVKQNKEDEEEEKWPLFSQSAFSAIFAFTDHSRLTSLVD